MGRLKEVYIEEGAYERAMEDLGREVDTLGKDHAAAMRVIFRHGHYSEYQRERERRRLPAAF